MNNVKASLCFFTSFSLSVLSAVLFQPASYSFSSYGGLLLAWSYQSAGKTRSPPLAENVERFTLGVGGKKKCFGEVKHKRAAIKGSENI